MFFALFLRCGSCYLALGLCNPPVSASTHLRTQTLRVQLVVYYLLGTALWLMKEMGLEEIRFSIGNGQIWKKTWTCWERTWNFPQLTVPEASASFEECLRLGKKRERERMGRGWWEGRSKEGVKEERMEGRKEGRSLHSEVLNKMRELPGSHIYMVRRVFTESNKMYPEG